MIPKTIHYCWFGRNPMPKLAKKCIRSWKKHCPDYEIVEWNEDNYDIGKNAYMREAYDAKKWGFVPDYARLDIIYRCGGIYLDTDVELLKSLDILLQNQGFAGFETAEYVALGLGFGAVAGNSTIKALLDSYEGLHFIHQDGTLNLIPSPQLNTEILKKIGLMPNNALQVVGNLTILPSDYLCPKSFETGETKRTPNTISIHHFDASWHSNRQRKDIAERWGEYRKDRLAHLPNRVGRTVLGDERYELLKRVLGR